MIMTGYCDTYGMPDSKYYITPWHAASHLAKGNTHAKDQNKGWILWEMSRTGACHHLGSEQDIYLCTGQ